MKVLLKLLIAICLFCNIGEGIAQSAVTFVYDSAGNRVSRTVVLTRAMNPDENEFYLKEHVNDWIVKVYPSESMVKVIIENYNEDFPVRYSLYNIQGVRLLSNTITESAFVLSMVEYSTGVYVLKINIGNHSSNWKFIKK